MTTKKHEEVVIPPHLQEWWQQLKRNEKKYARNIDRALEGLRKLGHNV